MLRTILFLLFGFCSGALAKQTVYQTPSDFLRAAFRGKLPPTQSISLSGAQQGRIARLLGHRYRTSRVRYWASGNRMVVILEEIGKTLPITTGYVVDSGKISQVKVLIYRESHGYEVSRTAFTRQFKGAQLRSDGRLTKRINNIAGATLSVRALSGLGRVALYLDQIRPR
ncbi:MAG: FMN-binding protein [Akkermansiaceae bacterium]|nr:FMN-binding protein [Akkermansiaceae bacterium]NNM30999.1 FMN-binding protein [Akkermansiaceae bacterium]